MTEIIEGKIPEQDMLAIEEKVINSDIFPWFIERFTTSLKYPCLLHILVGRYDEPPLTEFAINSPYFGLFEKIFLEFCYRNEVKVNRILRAAINLTWHNPAHYGDPHIDHDLIKGHRVCVMHLSDIEEGPTFIFKENKEGLDKYNIETEIKYEKGKIVIFSGDVCHAIGFCKKPDELRIACVITFD